jgi:homocysteine S-methyltransferase
LSEIHLIDGGLSTELERLGVEISGNLWTGQTLLGSPESIELAHRNYALAGAEVVITSSYQLSRQGFREIGLTDADADAALTNSVKVARSAVAGTGAKVAASVGPYGAVLHDGSEYRGDYSVSQSQLEDFHYARLEVLAAARPDYLAVETIPNVVEAKALASVLAHFDIPRWISFTAGTPSQLWSGESYEAAVEAVSGVSHLLAVGVNCVNPDYVSSLSGIASRVSGLPAIAYPNRGGTWDSAKGEWIGEKPTEYSEYLTAWIDSGVQWVGGCCGTHAGDIASLAKVLTRAK